MLALLTKLRPLFVFTVLVGFVSLIAVLLMGLSDIVFIVLSITVHFALYGFITTESFGPVAKLRSVGTRRFALVIFVLYTILIIALLYWLIGSLLPSAISG